MLSSSMLKTTDRLQLRDHRQPGGVGGVHHVALVHQPQADSPRQRRRDFAVNQLQFGVVDRRLVRFQRALILIHER